MTPSPAAPFAAARTYQVRTYGCQMNVHDSERLAGLLEGAGFVKADADELADVVVFNTCAVRENAGERQGAATFWLTWVAHRDALEGYSAHD